MKKLVLALAAVASLGASVANAGFLTVHNNASYTVLATPVGTNFNGTAVEGDQVAIFPGSSATFEYGQWKNVKYNIAGSFNGDQYRHITATNNHDRLYFHGPLWNPWISTSTDGI